ncbi:hypothetical protein E5288_WYG015866 [Bos mutus]|uniref:Uncharacterized protein n=1 Tax=Bos mutus TaxID=72004 RepID=A0A6B0RN09_9CETA|nr:hypothetical protein [Bos mutus]
MTEEGHQSSGTLKTLVCRTKKHIEKNLNCVPMWGPKAISRKSQNGRSQGPEIQKNTSLLQENPLASLMINTNQSSVAGEYREQNGRGGSKFREI